MIRASKGKSRKSRETVIQLSDRAMKDFDFLKDATREAPLIELRKYVERRMAKVRRAQAMARQDRDIQIADEFEAQLSELIALEKWLFRRARGESSPCLKS